METSAYLFKTGFVLCGVHMPCWDFVGDNSNCTMGLFWGRYRFFYLKIRLGTLCLFQNALLLLVENHFYELIGQIFEKRGEIRVRDSCARKSVKYRVQHRSTVIRVKHSFKNGQGSSPTYHSLFSAVSFLLLFDSLSYKTPICILSEDDTILLLWLYRGCGGKWDRFRSLNSPIGQFNTKCAQSHAK